MATTRATYNYWLAMRERLRLKTPYSAVLTASFLLFFLGLSANAKSVDEAVTDLANVQGTDPQGFRLMLFCIGLLFVVATTLILVTVKYLYKSSNQKSE